MRSKPRFEIDLGSGSDQRRPFIDVFCPLAADGLWVAEAETLGGAHPAWRGFTGVE